jgi:hypothetical protein
VVYRWHLFKPHSSLHQNSNNPLTLRRLQVSIDKTIRER